VNTVNTPRTAAVQMGAAIRAHQTSSVRVTEDALRRSAEANPALGAFVLIDEAGARASAATADRELVEGTDHGLLHGIPVAVKDIFDMTGLPTTCGSVSSFGTDRAEADADVVGDLRRSGAVIVGKTVLHEFAYGATGDRSAHGPSHNPYDHTRVSGGSSGGSAVAIASGMVPLSLGTDTAGSVRVPAALCGTVGFKPAFDALSAKGVYPLAPSLDHVGLFGTSVADTRIFYETLCGAGPQGRGPAHSVDRVGWIIPDAIAPTDEEITAAVRDVLERAGLDLADATSTVSGYQPGELFSVFTALQGREAFEVHRDHLDADEHLIDSGVAARLRAGQKVSDSAYADAQRARSRFRDSVQTALGEYGVLALPTTPITAPLLHQTNSQIGGATVDTRAALLSLTSPWNLTGSPAISVPGGAISGLPFGIQLITSPGNEATLFATASVIERISAQPNGR
jgi:Asp-tRNA(Asn)/Glu-tRNA(Gln) amidotransferase A subunit family amidase